MKINKPLQIIFVVFIGIIVSLVLLEVGLRIIGAVYQNITRQKDKIVIVTDKDHFNILCTGASWTAGAGAPMGEDYPSQLEEILNERIGGKTFTVFGRGMSGQNTSQILARLEEDIDDTKPNLVFFTGGLANDWNHWGFLKYKKTNKTLAVFADYLENIKIFKLGKILVRDIARNLKGKQRGISKPYNKQRKKGGRLSYIFKKRIKRDPSNGKHYMDLGMIYLRKRHISEASECFLKGIKNDPKFSGNYNGMGKLSALKGENEQAIKWYKKGIKVDPKSGSNYAGIGHTYYKQREYKKAIRWYEKAFKVCPSGLLWFEWRGSDAAIAFGYYVLADSYEKTGNHKKAAEYTNKLKLLIDGLPNNERRDVKRHLDKGIHDWIKADYTKVVAICRSQGIPVIIQTYPTDGRIAIWINKAIREVAYELGVPFVDQEKLFIEYFDISGANSDDYFELPANIRPHAIGGGHCNEKGYRFMAENLSNKIQEEEVFKE